jgi:hypothetical protein
MLLNKSKYIKDLHYFVNCKTCYIFTLTPAPRKKILCAPLYVMYVRIHTHTHMNPLRPAHVFR